MKLYLKKKANGYIGYAQADKENLIVSAKSSNVVSRGSIKRDINAPLALIIEPSKELAEQTFNQIKSFKKYLTNPFLKEVLIRNVNNLKRH